MLPLLSAAANTLLNVSYHSGLLSLVGKSRWRSERILVLAYHGFSKRDEHLWSDLYVEPGWFARRLDFIKARGYVPIALSQLLDYLNGADIPDRSVVITIDDGFHDFLEFAYPALNAAGLPATLYVTTYYVRNQWPVFDPALSYLMWKGEGRTFSLPWEKEAFQAPGRHDIKGRNDLHATLRSRWQALGIDAEEKHAALLRVGEAFGLDMDDFVASRMFGLLSPAEVAACSRGGIDVQLHTHRHRVPKADALLEREVVDNRDYLSGLVRSEQRLNHFCYPSGEYHASSPSLLQKLGVQTATTCEFGYVARSSNPLLLPRLLDSMIIHEARFAAWLSGFMAVRHH